jgi:GNAT superfamily N-acetyltransferase
MSDSECEIDLPSAAELAADAAWWGLYDSSFPPSEREPRSVVLRAVEMGVGVVMRGRVDGRTVALASVHLLRRPAAVFLVYLAVDPVARGAGMGRAMFEAAWREGARRLAALGETPGGMVWEVDLPRRVRSVSDDPDQFVDDASTDDEACRRRSGCFERLGGRVLARDYRQPPVDGVAAVPMWLMWRGAGEVDVRAIIRGIYFEKYGAVNGIGAEVLEGLMVARAARP